MQSTMNQPSEIIMPLGAFLVLKLESDDKLQGLTGKAMTFELPAKLHGKVGIAHVLEAGPGVFNADGKLIPIDVKKGDKVIVMKAGLMPIDPLDDDVVMALANNCVAKLVRPPSE